VKSRAVLTSATDPSPCRQRARRSSPTSELSRPQLMPAGAPRLPPIHLCLRALHAGSCRYLWRAAASGCPSSWQTGLRQRPAAATCCCTCQGLPGSCWQSASSSSGRRRMASGGLLPLLPASLNAAWLRQLPSHGAGGAELVLPWACAARGAVAVPAALPPPPGLKLLPVHATRRVAIHHSLPPLHAGTCTWRAWRPGCSTWTAPPCTPTG
jgi:hypothetical protein